MENIGKFQWKILAKNSGKYWQILVANISQRHTKQTIENGKQGGCKAHQTMADGLHVFPYQQSNSRPKQAFSIGYSRNLYQFCHRKNTKYSIYKKHSYNSVLFYIFRQFYILYIQEYSFFFELRENSIYLYYSIYNIIFSFLFIARIFRLYILPIYIQKCRISQNAHKGFQRPFWGRLIFTRQMIPKIKKQAFTLLEEV